MSMWVVTAANFINNVKNLDAILDTRKKTSKILQMQLSIQSAMIFISIGSNYICEWNYRYQMLQHVSDKFRNVGKSIIGKFQIEIPASWPTKIFIQIN